MMTGNYAEACDPARGQLSCCKGGRGLSADMLNTATALQRTAILGACFL